jgi:hypothetical protein
MSKRGLASAERRSVRNVIQNPRVQYRYALYLSGFGVAAAVISHIFMVRAFRDILIQTLLGTNIEPARLQAAVGEPLQALALQLALIYPILGIACAAFAIWVTHKFVGSQVALRRHISLLREGDYAAVCRLRSGDELASVAEALNELARELERQRREKLRAA